MNKFKQKVAEWLQEEIADVMSCYSLTAKQAKETVQDLMREDEYRDELTDAQVRQVMLLLGD